ncbi:MAG: DUF5672 family protein [Desulfuromonadaceae bacterium]|nr:DUF5672 family protein [Desulfuromonadaceae bacterium]MDD2854403.1 DUF5672 family protein [Desulfuromonadaceae bacterium]
MKNNITLLSIDTDPCSQELTRFALKKTLECIDARQIICFGHSPFGLGETFIKINRFKSIMEYSEFLLKCMWPYLPDDGHSMIIHWDGFAANKALWSDEFLQVDYIGAPWAWANDANCVGNGGFCLRSNALIKACSDVMVRRHPEVLFGHAEDIVICRLYREYFEKKGFRFADKELAGRFSFETGERTGDTFGFHAPENIPYYLAEAELLGISDHLFNKVKDDSILGRMLTASTQRGFADFSSMIAENIVRIREAAPLQTGAA